MALRVIRIIRFPNPVIVAKALTLFRVILAQFKYNFHCNPHHRQITGFIITSLSDFNGDNTRN